MGGTLAGGMWGVSAELLCGPVPLCSLTVPGSGPRVSGLQERLTAGGRRLLDKKFRGGWPRRLGDLALPPSLVATTCVTVQACQRPPEQDAETRRHPFPSHWPALPESVLTPVPVATQRDGWAGLAAQAGAASPLPELS